MGKGEKSLSKKEQQKGKRREEIPEFRISLQLEDRGVSVPLQGPGASSRGRHAGSKEGENMHD